MSTDENFKLTVDELKQMDGFESMNEEQSSAVIEAVFLMSILAFNAYNKENDKLML